MSIFLLVILGLVAYLLTANYRKIVRFARLSYRCHSLLKDIPGPPSLPLIGSAHLFKWDSKEFSYQLEDWARKYLLSKPDVTGMVKAYVGPVPLVFCGTKESIRPILESNVNITKPTQYDIISEWIGTGLLTSTNDKWVQRRKILTPAFHFNILQGYQDVFSNQGEVLVKCLEKEVEHQQFFDIFPYIKRCALDVICETAMGTEMNAQLGGNNDYVQAVTRLSAIIWDYQRFPWLWLKPVWYGCGLGSEFERLVKSTNDFTRKVISQRKAAMELESEDGETTMEELVKNKKMAFLDLLLNMQKENKMSDEDIREEVDTFMFEGHDTTSSGMGFTIWWLGQDQRCQELVHKEMDEIFGDSDRLPTSEDVKKMVYLEKCVKESLRLTPSVPLIARRLEHDVQIGKVTLPKDLTVVISLLTTARDPRAFDRPDEFYPEHFDAERTNKRDAYSHVPFSAGLRNCIGQKFAILEEKTVLSWIFRKFKVTTETPYPGNRPVPELILKPTEGFSVKLERRF